MKRTIHTLIALLTGFVMTTGCIKESLEDCNNAVFYLQYLADGDEDVLSKYIGKVDLYVFDENEQLLGQRSYSHDVLKNHAALPSFKLTRGKQYKIVALGNAFDNTEVVNFESHDLDAIYLQSTSYGRGEFISGNDHNYLGEKFVTIPLREGQVLYDTITLRSAHINIDLRVSGGSLPKPGRNGEVPYEVRFENSRPQVSLMNRINTDASVTCLPSLEYDAENGVYRTPKGFALFRLDSRGEVNPLTCSHEIVLREVAAGREWRFSLYEDYLRLNREMMNKALLQEASLPIELRISADVEIQIPDWDVEETEPGWED